MPNYPAEKADIRPGDIIVSINQSPVKTRADLRAVLETIQTETPISIVVKRNFEYITKSVVPKIIGESYIIEAIDRILLEENKKINLIIIANEITNTYGPQPDYTQLAEWKKAMAVQLRGNEETGFIRRYQNQPNFSIVARENTDKILQELRIQQSGVVTELIKSGKVIGATHLLVIDLNRSRATARVRDMSTSDRTSYRLIDIEYRKNHSVSKLRGHILIKPKFF